MLTCGNYMENDRPETSHSGCEPFCSEHVSGSSRLHFPKIFRDAFLGITAESGNTNLNSAKDKADLI